MFANGNRLFTAACAWLMLSALGHMSAIFSLSSFPTEVTEAIDSLNDVVLETGTPLSPTLAQVVLGAWIQVGALIAAVSVLNMIASARLRELGSGRRHLSFANAVVFGALAPVFVVVPIPQPLIVFGLAALLFGLDGVLNGAPSTD